MKGIIVAICITFVLTSVSFYHIGQSVVYTHEYTYYIKTEALLDSICAWDDTFHDTVMSTDVYYAYEEARANLY